MPTPLFLEWLDAKFADATGKVVPPIEVSRERLEATAEELVRARVRGVESPRALGGYTTPRAFARKPEVVQDWRGENEP